MNRCRLTMVKFQGPSKRKLSGGLRRKSKGKKQMHLARPATETHIGETKKRTIKTLGGNRKTRVQRENRVNVLDKETGKVKNVLIKGLESNPASRDYTRRKIMTKGAIINTEAGLAKITNRPGSDSVLNAVLVKE